MAVRVPEFGMADIQKLINQELDIHPGSDCFDLYKLLFQAFYGPTHMIAATSDIIIWIDKEHSGMKKPYLPLVQDIGLGRGFVRMSLSFLDNDRQIVSTDIDLRCISPADLAEAITLSKLPEGIDANEWFSVWQTIQAVVFQSIKPEIGQIEALNQMALAADTPHHSQMFRDKYEPHYRIVHHSILTQLVKLGVSI